MGTKNLIYDVCKLIGVEVDEKFKLKTFKDTTVFSVSNTGSIHIWVNGEYSCTAENGRKVNLTHLIMHYDEIIKMPWHPKDGGEYSSFFLNNKGKLTVTTTFWGGCIQDWARYEAGWVYQTQEEANAVLPVVATRLGLKYEF